jgi:putative membrane protein
MSGRESVREWVVVYLKGLFMGAADAVPGVSGGTIALITGIYERLIAAITALDPGALRYLPRLHRRTGRAELRAALVEMDVPFLLALGAGVVTALVTVARLMDHAFDTHPGLVAALFFGLIAASAVVLSEYVSLDTPRRVAVAAFGFALAFALSGPEVSNSMPNTPLFVLVAGSIAIAGMILPGISGAFFLYILGQYEYLTGQLTAFTDGFVGLASGSSVGALVEPGIVILAFVVGALVGLFSIAYAIRWALANYREATLTFLVSLMVGALRLPATKVLANTSITTPTTAGPVLVVAAVGGTLVFLVDRYTADIDLS